ncbi:Gfo/Idh/MocA family protein [Haladaptatus halobius]|uniref:Gfo/Idh/MocA family protein n=1 Tax=Haladaptatus halobius TaxID=2884875 RepID=UPI001D0B41B6|nr:Gfo/Idh/MocA family oxidoreductase [Haladaptatus halobius]
MRFAIVGCGTIAQVMHIPYVTELPGIELYALSDPAEDRVEILADRYNVEHGFASVEELLDSVGAELDAIIVLTPPHTHADIVELTLGAEIHTLVEKPLAVSPTDADRMVEAAEASDATSMVAYMKRYDPSYERAQEELAEIEAIDLVTAYDVDPDHVRILDEVYDIVGGTLPEEFIEESAAKRHADALTAIATDDDVLADDFDWHLEHVCHDVNALRGLLGDVERIEHVDVFADGRYATAHLVYEGGVRCVLDSGLSERKWFEQFIRVDAPDRMVNLEFSNPFIKNTPTELTVKQGIEELKERKHVTSYDEAFKREVKHFVRCVRGEAEVRTPFAEARDDVHLIADLFRTYEDALTLGSY